MLQPAEAEARIAKFRSGAFYAALQRKVDAYLAGSAAPAWYREAVARVRGREETFLRDDVLARIEPSLGTALLSALGIGGEHAVALLVSAMHAIPTHRPRFIAAEVVKADALVETRVLEDALVCLSIGVRIVAAMRPETVEPTGIGA